MMPAFKSELRKLLTVRSTYINLLITFGMVALFMGLGRGYKINSYSLADPTLLANVSYDTIALATIPAFVGLLLAGHEYRYNTIIYTLTATNRRFKVIAAKFLVITLFAAVVSVALALFGPLCTMVGLHFADKTAVAQHFNTWTVLWRCVVCGWGFAMYAFALILLLRNQIAAIVTFLILPTIGEGLLTQLLKNKADYLPYTALQHVVVPLDGISVTKPVLIVVSYVVVTLTLATLLFYRRDAN